MEQERVAREFQRTVIPKLFALALTIEAVLEITRPESVRNRLAAVVGDLDDVLREVRGTVFGRPLDQGET